MTLQDPFSHMNANEKERKGVCEQYVSIISFTTKLKDNLLMLSQSPEFTFILSFQQKH